MSARRQSRRTLVLLRKLNYSGPLVQRVRGGGVKGAGASFKPDNSGKRS